MMKRNITLLVLLALFGVFAGNAQSAAPPAPGIYIAGSYTDGVSERACYWVNGVRKDLPDGRTAVSIAVADGKVYAAGKDSSNKACYWVDGVKTQLDGDFIMTGMAAAGGTVYVVGYISASYSTGWLACYWIDGQRNIQGDYGTAFTGVAADDGILYFIGENYGVYSRRSFHWYKAYGQTIEIEREAQGIAVVNGIVYIAGAGPCYFVDGVRKDLPLPLQASRCYANSITAENGKVYAAGSYEKTGVNVKLACYWADGQIRELTGGVEAAAIAVSDGNIYAAGTYLQGSTIKSCYWVNGERKEFPGGRTASSIVIVK